MTKTSCKIKRNGSPARKVIQKQNDNRKSRIAKEPSGDGNGICKCFGTKIIYTMSDDKMRTPTDKTSLQK